MSEIRIKYDEMRSVARDFQAQAEAIERATRALNRRADQLLAGWEGVAEMSFMRELESCRSRLRRVPEMLSQVGLALKRTADQIEAAEREAARGMSSIDAGD